MNKIIKENRNKLRVLRGEKKDLISEILAKKSRKKEIESEMAQLRAEMKQIKNKDRNRSEAEVIDESNA